jgi:hypothetical protein
MTEPIHHADCYTEIVRVKDKSYHVLEWNCVEECKVNANL